MTANKDIDPVLIDVPMPIETPRLLLRPVRAGDGADTAAAIAETRDDLMQWMIWMESADNNTAQAQEIRARKAEAQFILREDILLVGIEKETGRPVIWTGLHRFDWKTRRFEIGYWVRKSAQGKGYAAESTNALTQFAFAALDARRVEIIHAEGNIGSRKVITKLGFEKEGVRKQAIALPGERMADAYIYARLSPSGLPPLDVRWGPP